MHLTSRSPSTFPVETHSNNPFRGMRQVSVSRPIQQPVQSPSLSSTSPKPDNKSKPNHGTLNHGMLNHSKKELSKKEIGRKEVGQREVSVNTKKMPPMDPLNQPKHRQTRSVNVSRKSSLSDLLARLTTPTAASRNRMKENVQKPQIKSKPSITLPHPPSSQKSRQTSNSGHSHSHLSKQSKQTNSTASHKLKISAPLSPPIDRMNGTKFNSPRTGSPQSPNTTQVSVTSFDSDINSKPPTQGIITHTSDLGLGYSTPVLQTAQKVTITNVSPPRDHPNLNDHDQHREHEHDVDDDISRSPGEMKPEHAIEHVNDHVIHSPAVESIGSPALDSLTEKLTLENEQLKLEVQRQDQLIKHLKSVELERETNERHEHERTNELITKLKSDSSYLENALAECKVLLEEKYMEMYSLQRQIKKLNSKLNVKISLDTTSGSGSGSGSGIGIVSGGDSTYDSIQGPATPPLSGDEMTLRAIKI